LPLQNPKIQADDFAKETGIDVYVPDIFNGSPPIKSEDLMPYETYEIGQTTSIWQKIGFFFLALRVIPGLLIFNSPKTVVRRSTKFLQDLKAEKSIERIGAVGYCFGGMVIVNLAHEGLLQVGVIAHPGNVSNEAIAKINFPVSWLTAEEDPSFPIKQQQEAEAIFAGRTGADKVDYEFKHYKGTKHGFAARPALQVPVVKQAFEDACDQTVAWFKKYM